MTAEHVSTYTWFLSQDSMFPSCCSHDGALNCLPCSFLTLNLRQLLCPVCSSQREFDFPDVEKREATWLGDWCCVVRKSLLIINHDSRISNSLGRSKKLVVMLNIDAGTGWAGKSESNWRQWAWLLNMSESQRNVIWDSASLSSNPRPSMLNLLVSRLPFIIKKSTIAGIWSASQMLAQLLWLCSICVIACKVNKHDCNFPKSAADTLALLYE